MDKRKSFSLLQAVLRARNSRAGWDFRVSHKSRRHVHNPADDPSFLSVVDNPPQIVSTNKKHTFLGVLTLSLIPVTAFCLGTWQVQRLDWKTKLIAKFEDRLVRPPLPLPPRIDPSAVCEFDYRRVYATGKFRHDKEMLIGPRIHDGTDGFLVITPLERPRGASTILVNRGWIRREKQFQQDRLEGALPQGEVNVAGLLREPWRKNLFTPVNKPEDGKFYFPDVEQMAQVAGAEAVWIEETMGLRRQSQRCNVANGVQLRTSSDLTIEKTREYQLGELQKSTCAIITRSTFSHGE
jgi:surfeit locus 1 family protein